MNAAASPGMSAGLVTGGADGSTIALAAARLAASVVALVMLGCVP
jgi:hypothetical protein